jgi:dTMP kinase
VIEGLDGAGTTTQTRRLAEALTTQGRSVSTTREPSDRGFGALLRTVMDAGTAAHPPMLALGFATDRLDHTWGSQGIVSRLLEGVDVICDRYVLSSLAYQSAQGVALDWLSTINQEALVPDVTVLIDTHVSSCAARLTKRATNQTGLFHDETVLTHVRQHYLRVIQSSSFVGQLITVDGNPPPETVTNAILSQLPKRTPHQMDDVPDPSEPSSLRSRGRPSTDR